MTIEIRPSTLEDADDIAANIKVANTPEQIREQLTLFAAKRDEGWEHLVAIDGGGVVGNIVVMPTRFYPAGEPHRAEIADVVVSPTHQGTGLLEQLVAAAEHHARVRGISQLETGAWLSNPRAIGAYRKLGFEEWGRLPNALRRADGSYDTLVCFARVVDQA